MTFDDTWRHCCEAMTGFLTGDMAPEDKRAFYVEDENAYGIYGDVLRTLRFGIAFCPWCGTKLPQPPGQETATPYAPGLPYEGPTAYPDHAGPTAPSPHTPSPGDRPVAAQNRHCCEPMTRSFLDYPADQQPVYYSTIAYFYGLPSGKERDSYFPISFCPWCGTRFPREEGELPVEIPYVPGVPYHGPTYTGEK